MNIKILREKAIKRYINGESPKEIYQSLGKGKTWFFKWLKRYYLEEKDWSKDHSHKPHLSPKRINKAMEQLIVKTRKQLVKQKYAQVGAANITWHLQQAGMISIISYRNDQDTLQKEPITPVLRSSEAMSYTKSI